MDNVQKRNICTNVPLAQFLEDIIFYLVNDRNQLHGFVKMAINFRNSIKGGKFLVISKGTLLHEINYLGSFFGS
jgi:hypothetical protein